jgi:hypothetical protein
MADRRTDPRNVVSPTNKGAKTSRAPPGLVTRARRDRAVEAQSPSEVKNPDNKHRENSQGSLQIGECWVSVLGIFRSSIRYCLFWL